MKFQAKKIMIMGLLIVLALFIIYALLPYRQGFFGALIIYSLLKPLYTYLVKKKIPAKISAIIVIILCLLIIITPIVWMFYVTLDQAGTVLQQKDSIVQHLSDVELIFPKLDIKPYIPELAGKLGNFIQTIIVYTIGGIVQGVVSLFLLFFMLYYLFIRSEEEERLLYNWSPFSRRNTRKFLQEFHDITKSSVITTAVIALLQGTIIGLSFYFLGIPSALFWGFFTTLVSFIPFLGPFLVWIPATLILFAQGDVFSGSVMLILGIFVSTIDNILRPFIQQKVGKTPPIITLLGIFIGLPFFGIWGLIIGPLLLSYFFLILRMFHEEYSGIF